MLEINKDPSKSDLRWFGLILAIVFVIVGLVVWLKTSWLFGMGGSPTLASKIFWGIAIVFPVVYYAIPPLRRHLFIGFMYAVFPIGLVVSNVILAATFYLVVAPIGLIMRLFGHDPMQRKLLPEARTYWIERSQIDDPERYFKQF
ncbi:MAG: hypothetical protein EA380_00035 [Phycisphaeraceae bacterium]|nr:MAG: hypothetical protein EA380_00035 [Phycisphaeraceae bacterium]